GLSGAPAARSARPRCGLVVTIGDDWQVDSKVLRLDRQLSPFTHHSCPWKSAHRRLWSTVRRRVDRRRRRLLVLRLEQRTMPRSWRGRNGSNSETERRPAWGGEK